MLNLLARLDSCRSSSARFMFCPEFPLDIG
jgi:hypothetical protein